jgi:hypothetical protein
VWDSLLFDTIVGGQPMSNLNEIDIVKHRLKRAIYELRHEAIETGDFEGWRISRSARDASTIEQLREAERRVGQWWKRRH